jgi:hypothetical protein
MVQLHARAEAVSPERERQTKHVVCIDGSFEGAPRALAIKRVQAGYAECTHARVAAPG